MSTVDEVASLVSAAASVLAAVAALMSAMRDRPKRPRRTPGASTGSTRRPVPVAAGRVKAGQAGAGPAKAGRAGDGHVAAGRADWRSAAFGGVGLVLALIYIIAVAVSDGPPHGPPTTILRFSVVPPLALAVFFGVRGVRAAVRTGHRDLLMSACAGLTAALGVLVAVFIAGTSAPVG